MVRWRTICSALARPAASIAFLSAVAGCLCAQGQSVAAGSNSDQDGNWVATWGCAPGFAIGQELADQTIRQFARISVGGNRVRIRLSNETGTQPLVIGTAHLAVAGREPGSIDPSTDHVMNFCGSPTITIPPGSLVLSDPVEFELRPLTKLAVSLYITRDTGSTVIHSVAEETGYLSESGDETGAPVIPGATTVTERYFLTRIEVSSSNLSGAIVALGDSITDGHESTVDADRRWPDRLAERLNDARLQLGIVNAGISGNRILYDHPEMIGGPSALSRFDRDVSSVPGAKFLIVLEGINDIRHPADNDLPDQAVTSDQIIGGLKQIIARAHGRKLKVFGVTLLPFGGDSTYTEHEEAMRVAINQWIRTSKSFDGVIDFDSILRDPAHPSQIRAEYLAGDHVHPNDAGYRVLADSIDLKLFSEP